MMLVNEAGALCAMPMVPVAIMDHCAVTQVMASVSPGNSRCDMNSIPLQSQPSERRVAGGLKRHV